MSLTWDVGEDLYRLVHDFEGIVDILLNGLGINRGQWVVHPALVPSQPVRDRDPQVAEGIKVLNKLGQLVVLKEETGSVRWRATVCGKRGVQW